MGTIDFYFIIHIEQCQISKGKSLTLNATLTVNRPSAKLTHISLVLEGKFTGKSSTVEMCGPLSIE